MNLKYAPRSILSILSTVALTALPVAILAAASLSAISCSDSSAPGDSSDPSIPVGDEDFVPPPSDDGSGQPPDGATTVSCQSSAGCAYWYCECADGAVVNTANCTNGFCLDAETTCPEACEFFDHGDWNGRVGGGPEQPTPNPDPPPNPSSCGSQGSTPDGCWSCIEAECCSESAACYDNPDCLGYWDCFIDCGLGDPNCESECGEFYPFGVDDYYDLVYCGEANCSFDC